MTILLSACNSDSPKSALPDKAIKTYVISAAANDYTRLFSGVVRSADEAKLSFRIPGEINFLQSKLGRTYQKGDIIASLDKKQLSLKLMIAKSDVNKAQALLIESEKNYQAMQSLNKNSHVSDIEFEQAKAAYNVKLSQVQLAKTHYDIAKENLQYADIRAPFHGVVSEVFVKKYATITPGKAIIDFHGLGQYEVKVGIPDRLINDVTLDQRVFIKVDNFLKALQGNVTEISASSNQAYVYPVIIRILNPPKEIKSGLTAETTFSFKHKGQHKYFLIPVNSIVPAADGKGMSVYQYTPKTKTVSLIPIYAASINNNMAEVQKGLKKGDVIAISGARFLHDGQKVSLYTEDK